MADNNNNGVAETQQRRTSERNRGKRVSYNEKDLQKIELDSPVKKRKYRTNGGGPRKPKAVSTPEKPEEEMEMEMEMVQGLLDCPPPTSNTNALEQQLESLALAHTLSVDKSDHFKVKETLRLFNKFYLHLIQEEENRCKAIEAQNKKDGGKKKMVQKRPDLKAISKIQKYGKVLYPDKRIGAIPGVDVGQQFFSRAEMVAIGFHSHWLNGIDFMGNKYFKGEYSKYTFPLAVAIVLSGQYEDDLDNSEDVIYTGQGGNNLLGDKKQVGDQKMERGNLALKNSMEHGLPVRVVRGHFSKNSYVGKVYTYDGLYKVVNYWAEKGVSGFIVYKFRMKRMDDQPELTTTQVQFIRGKIPDSISEVRGLVCNDISEGQEDIPIPATNVVDDPPVPPFGFTYLKSIEVASDVIIPAATRGCDCKGSCTNANICACARLNGSDFPYVQKDGGRLVEAKAVVFECGPKCGCGPSCINRVSQKGLRYRFEVFRTPKKGWGVRSWDYIPAGAPICEYTGVLKKSVEVDSVRENNFIFDIDCLQTMKGLDGREMRLRDVSIPDNLLDNPEEKLVDSNVEFCIDAGVKGNFARFINHSCEPNLFVQCVLNAHHDVSLARVVLFAADNIAPLQELTYDYGYTLGSVIGQDGKVKEMPCYCGAPGCRKRLF